MTPIQHSSRMQHPAEDELIALQLGEAADPQPLRAHLEHCAACAALAESIAETLRIFSADPVPEADLERNWQRLRASLPPLYSAKRKPTRRLSLWMWPAVFAITAALALVGVTYRSRPLVPAPERQAVLHKAGPLTEQPADPALAQQISSAEQLLTQVNHSSGPLDDTTRAEAHTLLLRNAVYIRTARARGDYGAASVLEELDPVLTEIDHDGRAGEHGMHLRMEWNTQGLLLDLRILEQNDASSNAGQQQQRKDEQDQP